MMAKSSNLKRTLSTWLVFTYGLGTVLGAGIYVLIGKVAAFASVFAPISFLLASLVAAFSALSYAKLCSFYPKAAGEAVYVQEAFHQKWLTAIVGWMVVTTGVVSAAAMARGFVGYFQVFINLPAWLIIVPTVLVLGLLAIWGISQSVIVAAVITLIELGGLILVITFSGFQLTKLPEFSFKIGLPHGEEWLGIALGTFLAFYAFIGFEDMVNLAEEVKDASKKLPRAIILVLATATVLYILTALATVLVLPIDELAESSAPFALLFEKEGLSPLLISLISLIAIINGVLVQIIMASRVLYGMGKQQTAPKLFSWVHPTTQTPIWSTVFMMLVLIVLALWFPIIVLAQVTSFIILIVFAFVNLSLIVLKMKKQIYKGSFAASIGFLLCLLMLIIHVATYF